MAANKIESGKPDTISYAGIAVNKANQPRELRILGAWKRWEPASMDGCEVKMTQAELDSEDFAAYAKLFNIKSI